MVSLYTVAKRTDNLYLLNQIRRDLFPRERVRVVAIRYFACTREPQRGT